MGPEVVVLVVTLSALLVSSIAGYGGSLILVPALAAVLDPRAGVALAALLLGWNNVFKVIAYRRTLALRQGWPLLLVTAAGVWAGANVLIAAPDEFVISAIVAVPAMAASGVLSGVSGSRAR